MEILTKLTSLALKCQIKAQLLGILKLFFRTNDEETVITMSELRALAIAAADRGISGWGYLLDGNDAIRSHYYGRLT